MYYNPYEIITNETNKNMQWMKSNFHMHAGVGIKGDCGEFPTREVVDAYAQAGYKVLAVTNHNTHIPYATERDDISLINGVEYSHIAHMVLLGTDRFEDINHQEAIDRTVANGGFVVLCHPNWYWENREHWSLEMLEQVTGYTGLEIINMGAYNPNNWGSGSGLALDKWDYLLTAGRKVWGFGTDDFHYWNDMDKAFNMIYAKSGAYADVKEAVEFGRFYVSTGVVELERFSFKGGRISVKAKLAIPTYSDTFEYRFIGTGGKLLYEVTGRDAEYMVDPAERYVRVEVTVDYGAKIYLQPVLNMRYFKI